jgi:hypothetical protein
MAKLASLRLKEWSLQQKSVAYIGAKESRTFWLRDRSLVSTFVEIFIETVKAGFGFITYWVELTRNTA